MGAVENVGSARAGDSETSDDWGCTGDAGCGIGARGRVRDAVRMAVPCTREGAHSGEVGQVAVAGKRGRAVGVVGEGAQQRASLRDEGRSQPMAEDGRAARTLDGCRLQGTAPKIAALAS